MKPAPKAPKLDQIELFPQKKRGGYRGGHRQKGAGSTVVRVPNELSTLVKAIIDSKAIKKNRFLHEDGMDEAYQGPGYYLIKILELSENELNDHHEGEDIIAHVYHTRKKDSASGIRCWAYHARHYAESPYRPTTLNNHGWQETVEFKILLKLTPTNINLSSVTELKQKGNHNAS